MIHECTDCKHCADFCDGWRVVCCNPTQDSGAMCDYYPVGEKDALTCGGFEDGDAMLLWSSHYSAATEWAEKQAPDGEATWELMRQWCLQKGDT